MVSILLSNLLLGINPNPCIIIIYNNTITIYNPLFSFSNKNKNIIIIIIIILCSINFTSIREEGCHVWWRLMFKFSIHGQNFVIFLPKIWDFFWRNVFFLSVKLTDFAKFLEKFDFLYHKKIEWKNPWCWHVQLNPICLFVLQELLQETKVERILQCDLQTM